MIVFDEYRIQFSITDLLNYTDIYPLHLPARYSNKYACYETVYIISNESLEDLHKSVQKDKPESWKAFLRRISEIRVYNADKTIDTYDSVEKYMNRSKTPQTISQEQLDILLLKKIPKSEEHSEPE